MMFANPSKRKLTELEIVATGEYFDGADAMNAEYTFYERMCLNGVEYHSKSYRRAGRSCSYIVQYKAAEEGGLIGNGYGPGDSK